MKGANGYAQIFTTGQYGRLYIVSGSHARGCTFRIFVLPKDEIAIQNGPNNPPLNSNIVEVYGIISGQPGWTEEYGWIHQGNWQDDFWQLSHDARAKYLIKELEKSNLAAEMKAEFIKQTKTLLSDY